MSATSVDILKEKKQSKAQWQRLLKDSIDADSWGQSLEAIEQYEKLVRTLESRLSELQLTSDEKSQCQKIAHAVQLRMYTLQGQEAEINDDSHSSQQRQQVSLDELRSTQSVLNDLFEKPLTQQSQFPIEFQNFRPNMVEKKESSVPEVFIAHDDRLEKEEQGSLLQPPKVKAGQTTISIQIDKIGLKDAQTYINSFITVSVADVSGAVLESQDTPKSNTLKPNYVIFGSTVHIQCAFEEIQKKNLCIFLEFKHYKPSKKKISTRCFALMEPKEIEKAKDQAGACLELYKKPTDFARRSLSLFTVKQLYLHLSVTFTKH